jgi:hypothetical protein
MQKERDAHFAKQKPADGRDELVKGSILGLFALLDPVRLQRKSSRFALEFKLSRKISGSCKNVNRTPDVTLPSVQLTTTAGYKTFGHMPCIRTTLG